MILSGAGLHQVPATIAADERHSQILLPLAGTPDAETALPLAANLARALLERAGSVSNKVLARSPAPSCSSAHPVRRKRLRRGCRETAF
ncbi:MAG: hypothetical protein M3Y58_15670 [Chloroflexota bacterium]|nr:hypothetical protein [Chloroflexota bacterium]